MSDADRAHRDDRHPRQGAAARPPSEFLVRCLRGLPPGRALDVAAGEGRNALLLARCGFAVDAIDASARALASLREAAARESLAVNTIEADLEHAVLPARTYDLVANIRYLQRSLFPALARSLRRGGHLVFETFLWPQRMRGHPRNPAYLLAPGELPRAFSELEIIEYEEGLVATEFGDTWLARPLARQP